MMKENSYFLDIDYGKNNNDIIANTQKSKNNDIKIQNNKILFNKVEYQVHPKITDHAVHIKILPRSTKPNLKSSFF